jgi:hypothetical protein
VRADYCELEAAAQAAPSEEIAALIKLPASRPRELAGHGPPHYWFQLTNAPVPRVPEPIVAVLTGGVEHAIGFAASVLAILCQIILLATISLPPFAIRAGPVGNARICHADDETQPSQQPEKSDHHSHDCALCVLCLSHAHALAVLAPVLVLPERQSIETVQLAPVWPRAPPVRLTFAPQPRGPPPLS